MFPKVALQKDVLTLQRNLCQLRALFYHVQLSFKAPYTFAMWHHIIYSNADFGLQMPATTCCSSTSNFPVSSFILFPSGYSRPCVTDSHCWNPFYFFPKLGFEACGASFMFRGKSYFPILCPKITIFIRRLSSQIKLITQRVFNKSCIIWKDKDSDQIGGNRNSS